MVKSKKISKKEKVSEDAMDIDPKIEDSAQTKVEDEITQGNEDVGTKKRGKAVKKEESSSQEDVKEEDADDSETQENGEVTTDKKPADKKGRATKKAVAKPAVEPARKSSRTPKPVSKENGDGEESYEVEQVVGMRVKSGKKEFKIRWKGYKASDDTWEPEKHLSCQDLIQAYIDEHQDEENEEKTTPPKKAKTETKVSQSKRTKRK